MFDLVQSTDCRESPHSCLKCLMSLIYMKKPGGYDYSKITGGTMHTHVWFCFAAPWEQGAFVILYVSCLNVYTVNK